MSEKIKNGLRAGIEYIKTYGCGCDHDVGFICAECCLGRAVSDGLKEIQSLEQEVARLREENKKTRNKYNCQKYHKIDANEEGCMSFSCPCDKWEPRK